MDRTLQYLLIYYTKFTSIVFMICSKLNQTIETAISISISLLLGILLGIEVKICAWWESYCTKLTIYCTVHTIPQIVGLQGEYLFCRLQSVVLYNTLCI